MKARPSLNALCGCLLLFAILPAGSAEQAAAAQAAPPAGVCGGQPACYETGDFAAAITDYRVSDWNGYKVIDMTVRFANKTNRPLILGYTDGSAMALDDQGNRFGLNGGAGANAVRGIGRVVGNNIDPKFVLQPGSVGDSMFELIGRPSGTAGVTFEHDLTIREITPLEGNQFSLAGEFPLQFRGLANGMFGGGAGGGAAAAAGAPAAAPTGSALMTGAAGTTAAGQPCTTDGPGAASGAANSVSDVANAANSVAGQKMPAGANNAINTATSSISSLGGLFGRKKAAAAATPAAAPGAAASCVPAAQGGTATGASTLAGFANAVPGVAGSAFGAAGSATATTTNATGTTVTTINGAPQMVKGSAAGTTGVPGGQPMVRTATPTTPHAAPVQAANTAATTAPTTKTAPTAKPAAKKPATTAASGTTGQK